MTRARVEGAAKPVAKKERPSVGFRAAINLFKQSHPDKWEDLRLTPTQHGLEAIAEQLERL